MSDQKNILNIKCRQEFRHWLAENSSVETECWIHAERGKPTDDDHLWYLDAVEETLCYGWIDSTAGKIDSISYQRFSPRRKNSPWTELNKERVRRLEKLGLMTDVGRKVLPPMGARSFKFDPDVELALKQACVWTKFRSFPIFINAFVLTMWLSTKVVILKCMSED